jgi:LysR family hydrogen peroxide-inducible transcriptional activator
MVAAKMGLTILPLTAANIGPYKHNMLVNRPLKSINPGRIVALAWRKSYTRLKAIDALIEAALKCDLIGSVK